MERRLYRAAVEGDVSSLLQLLHGDKLLLDRSLVAGNTTETPLHIAAMLGHLEFAKKLLQLMPRLASEVDSQRSTPLHLAAAKGYVDIVEILMMVDPETCLATDKYGRNPIHVAAVKGRVEVLTRLVNARPDAARSVSRKGETVLHMCVKHNQLEALRVVVGVFGGEDYEFMNRKDEDGNSVLHLAAIDEQGETMEFLMNNTKIEVNSLNKSGFKALDLLPHTWISIRETEASNSTQRELQISATRAKGVSSKRAKITSKGYNWKKLYKRQNNWVVRMRESLMVVAILTATMAFQAGLNPPAGVWQENSPPQNNATSTNLTLAPSAPTPEPPSTFDTPFFFNDEPSNDAHFIGFSVMADNFPILYACFLGLNTTGFLASLSVILLLISGLPTRNRFFMLILMVIMWTAITSIALTYAVSISVLTPKHERWAVNLVIQLLFIAWFGLMLLLLISHTIRLVVKMIRKIYRAMIPNKRTIPV